MAEVAIGFAPTGWQLRPSAIDPRKAMEVLGLVLDYAKRIGETDTSKTLAAIVEKIVTEAGNNDAKFVELGRYHSEEICRLLLQAHEEQKPLEGIALEHAILRNFETVSRFDFGVEL